MGDDYGMIVGGVGFVSVACLTLFISSHRDVAIRLWEIARAITPRHLQDDCTWWNPISADFQHGMRLMGGIQMAVGVLFVLLGLAMRWWG